MESAELRMTSRRRLVLAMSVASSLAVLGWAQYRIRIEPSDHAATAVLLAAALAAAILVAGRSDAGAEATGAPEPERRSLATAVTLLGYAGIVAGSVILSVKWRALFVLGVTVLLLGVATLSAGLSRSDPPARGAASDAARGAVPAWTRSELAVFLGTVGLAFALRFYRFTEFPDPYGIFAVEEPQTGMGGYLILQGRRPWEFLLDHYLAALALRVGGPELPALRVPFAVFSALTVVPMYLLLRQLVRKPAALCGALLLAGSSWHLLYARCAHNIFLTTFIVVVVLALLVAAERTHRLALFPWIGLLAGYTLYTYAGYRGTVAFVVLFLAIAASRHLRGSWRASAEARLRQARWLVRDLDGLWIVTFVVTALVPPIAVQVARDPRHISYFEAAGRATDDAAYYTTDVQEFVRQRIERAGEAAAIFLHAGDISPTFNYPGTPMLDPVTGTLFVAGFLYAVCFPRRGHNAFFVLMFLGLFVVGTIFVHNLDVRRLHGLIPLVIVFAALFVDRLFACAERLGSAALGVAYCGAALAVLGALSWGYDLFFNQMANSPAVRAGFHNEYTRLIRLGREQAAGRYLLVVSDIPNFFLPSDYTWLIRDHIKGQALSELGAILPPRALPRAAEPLSVVVLPPYEGAAIAGWLRLVFPGTECRADNDPPAWRSTMTVCNLPGDVVPADATAAGMLTARYFLRPPPEGKPVVERREPFISYALVPPLCRRATASANERECHAEWEGQFELPADVRVTIAPRTRAGSVRVFIDGQPVGGAMQLARGTHTFRASAHFPRTQETGVQVKWQLPGEAPTLMPFHQEVAR
jgi:hypothetical protein